ncbi:MAG: type II secretion system F family protein [Candidatus Omnitrophica bacterium]|nr:type II secretion system F family protein [Candidatus Omnitrophota bacterium]
MLILVLIFSYAAVFMLIMAFMPVQENRPTLGVLGLTPNLKKKKGPFDGIRKIAVIMKPVVKGDFRKRYVKDLATARWGITPEEFMLLKIILIVGSLFLTFPAIGPDAMFIWIMLSLAVGYVLPEFMLKSRIKKVKDRIVKELPDAIDLLALCVNAGLDFMLSLKWVVDKSPPSVMIDELNTVLQEINVGKTRREAIKDLSLRYELPDLSTFARTLIQADKMGTSMTEALNILAEDMRQARFRRGEQVALKAPMKMLIPLLLFIFPVVGILVAGPILLDFIQNNPFQNLAGG